MNLIIDKDQFINNAMNFFTVLFETALENEYGDIEIRTAKTRPPRQYYLDSEEEAAKLSYELCNQGIDVYFGVNPRMNKDGKKENVHWVTSFHAEIDYGSDGHGGKNSIHKTYDEALNKINSFRPEPTKVVHSGGGFHCYWVLRPPISVNEYKLENIESINKGLTKKLGGDVGTQDISRILRVPGTFNFKLQHSPRAVSQVGGSGKKYSYKEFEGFVENVAEIHSRTPTFIGRQIDISTLPISEKTRSLIVSGNDGTYPSNSEVDMAVITVLLNNAGMKEDEAIATIKSIFDDLRYKVGEKYRNHSNPAQYLKHTIESCKENKNLTPEEALNPLFATGSIGKTSKGLQLNNLSFQEYIVRKYNMKLLDQEKVFFIYNKKCYEQLTSEALNKLCQFELGKYRGLFKKGNLDEFVHFAIGDVLIDNERATKDQLDYLTLQNGLFNLDECKLIPHTPDIFTTNLLPYNYDPEAKCERFIQYLNEIFINDQNTIDFVQEAVGYVFHKALPTPAMFLMVGGGSNGKSVLINGLVSLFGKENASNISLNKLNDDLFARQLFQKYINVSSETPRIKDMNTDVIKAASAGDWIVGRDLYKPPMKFRPYAKHFIAMNELPFIGDDSYGMWRRFKIINFPRTITEDEMDRELENKLNKYLPGMFNWALEGYKRLRERNFQLNDSPSMITSKNEFRNSINSARCFVNERLVSSDNTNDRLKFSSAYEKYVNFCRTNSLPEIKPKGKFKQELKGLGYNVDYSTLDGYQLFVFRVKLIED